VTSAGGRVFLMDRQAGEERVLCLEAASGEPVWEHRYRADYGDLDYGSGPRASVTLHAGRTYSVGAVGHVRCLDAATGAVVWGKDAVADLAAARPTWGFAASPVVWKDTVILHLGLPGGAYAAFDLATGAERWRGSADPAGYATPVLARHQGRDLMVGWTPEHIQGLSPDTGEVYWSVPYPVRYGVSIAEPLVREGVVLVCGYWHGSKAVRLGDGPSGASLLWEDEEGLRGLMSQPLYHDGFVYLLDRSKGLTCFELATGMRRWDDSAGHTVTPADRNPQASLVWVCEQPGHPSGRALAFNANGELLSLSLAPDGFTLHSRAQLCGRTWAHPAYDGHRVTVRTDEEVASWEVIALAPGAPD
jgi:outer membrane protein assembly factor BamB